MTIDFSCQDRTPEFSSDKRERISKANIMIVGVGALGTVASELLVRSGALNITLIDDDNISESNLPRQMLFFEKDVGRKKVEVAQERLKQINEEASIGTTFSRLDENNCDELLKGADIILDCTDNITTRMIIDDHCRQNNMTWVHASAQRAIGEVMLITPNSARYSDYMKGKKENKNCSDQGILGVTSMSVANLQVTMALKALSGDEGMAGYVYRINIWDGSINKYSIKKPDKKALSRN